MNPIRTLADAPAGEAVEIIAVTGGRALAMRLASLGFTPGTRVVPTRNWGVGPVIVLVRETRLALGRGEATSIQVAALEPPAAEAPAEAPAETPVKEAPQKAQHGH